MSRYIFQFACCAAVTLLATACGTADKGLQTSTGDTRPQPIIVQVPIELSSPELEAGCWVQFYSARNFKGVVTTLAGPVSLESADKMSGRHLKQEIESLVTGSKATLRVYEHAMFKDRSVSFGPNSRETGLVTNLGIGGHIESMQLDCARN